MIMVLIPEAKDSNGKKYTVDALELLKTQNSTSNVLYDLHCVYCNVRLEFRQGSNTREAYLCTWRKEEHLDTCPISQRTRFGLNASVYDGNTVPLTSEDKNNKRDYLYKVLHTDPSRLGQSNDRKKYDADKKSGSVESKGVGTIQSSANDSAGDDNKHRSPRVMHVSAGSIDSGKIGKLLLIYGNIYRVDVFKNSAKLFLKTRSGKTEFLTSPDFFIGKRGLMDRFKLLHKFFENNSEEYEAYIFAEIQYKNQSSELQCTIYNENDIGLPRKNVSMFLYEHRNEIDDDK